MSLQSCTRGHGASKSSRDPKIVDYSPRKGPEMTEITSFDDVARVVVDPMEICTSGVTHLVCQREPGVLTTSGESIFSKGIWWLCANDIDMNECEAPESNNTEAGYVLIRSVPIRTPGSSSTPSAETWFRRPRLTVVALAAGVEGAGAGAEVAGAFWGHSLE